MATNQSVLWEEIWKRTPSAKHFHLADGSKQAIIYLNDIHYEDENGNYQNIDTALHDEADFDLWDFPVTKHGVDDFHAARERARADKAANRLNRDTYDFQALKVPFAAKIPRNWKRGYSINKGADKLTFKPIGASPSKGYVTEGKDNEIVYQDAWNDVDVALNISETGIKETLTLKTSKAPTSFTFEVIGNLADDLTAGEIKIQPAWLEDAAGVRRDVTQTLRREVDGVLLDIAADVSGLAFPVIIDPTITIQPTSSTGQDSYVLNLNPDYVYGNMEGLSVGNDNDSQAYIYRAFIKFGLTSIPSNAVVSSSSITLTEIGGQDTSSLSISTHKVLGSWDEATLTWNNKPPYDATAQSTVSTLLGSNYKYTWALLASLVQGWVNNSAANYGVMFKLVNESVYSSYRAFGSSEWADQSTIYLPKIDVTYTEPPTAPAVTSPNGGETWNAIHTVTWTAATDPDTAQASLQYQIQLSTDNGANYSDIVALTVAGATSYAYDFSAKPQSSTCHIRIRAYDGTSYGAWDTSDGVFTIQHNQAPTAPTLLSPDGGVSRDRAQVIRLSWQHNDPNAPDPQSQFDLMYSTDGGTNWTTVSQVTTNQYYDVPANTLPHGNVVWKVRTYDQAGLSSPYSAQATFLAGDQPASATITAPTGTVAVARPTVQWSSAGQVDYQVQVLDSLSAVAWDSGDVVSTNKAQTVGIDLANTSNYTIQVRIKNADGLWSDWATSAISVSYTPPALPTITATAQTGYITIGITNPVPGGTEPNVSSNDVYRRKSGEASWTRIATGIPANGSYSDYATASGITYEYKVRAQGDNGTFSDSAVANANITLTGVWLHDVADSAATIRRYQYDGDGRSVNWETDAVMLQFAGRSKPVAEFGETNDGRVRAQLLLNDENDFAALESLVYRKSTVCYRDGRGRKTFGIVKKLPIDDQTFGYTTSVEIFETDYKEEV
ncbi:hypothetical protein JCM15765_14660 [Paradesulfitobacterium aromaticivorans]